MHCMTWYIGTCGITAMGLLYKLSDMVKCVCYMGFGFNSYFVAGTALVGDHYRMDIINIMGHLRSDSVMPLVLCMVVYNIRGTVIVLQVSRDSVNLSEKG